MTDLEKIFQRFYGQLCYAGWHGATNFCRFFFVGRVVVQYVLISRANKSRATRCTVSVVTGLLSRKRPTLFSNWIWFRGPFHADCILGEICLLQTWRLGGGALNYFYFILISFPNGERLLIIKRPALQIRITQCATAELRATTAAAVFHSRPLHLASLANTRVDAYAGTLRTFRSPCSFDWRAGG